MRPSSIANRPKVDVPSPTAMNAGPSKSVRTSESESFGGSAPRASSRCCSISAFVSPSTFSRSSGSVLDARTFIHQSGYEIVTPSR